MSEAVMSAGNGASAGPATSKEGDRVLGRHNSLPPARIDVRGRHREHVPHTMMSSRNALLDVLRQHLVNQCLVADLSPPGFLAEVIQDVGVYSDGDETSRAAELFAAHDPTLDASNLMAMYHPVDAEQLRERILLAGGILVESA